MKMDKQNDFNFNQPTLHCKFQMALSLYRQLPLRRNGIMRQFHRNRFESSSNAKPNKIPYIKIATGMAIGSTLAYDYLKNELTYVNATSRFLRSLKVAFLISKDYAFLMRRETSAEYDTLLKEVHQKSASRVLDACLLNGGLYIKIGQGVAAINHMLPEEYIVTLSALQDKCLPSSKESVQRVFLDEFKMLPEDIFAEFNYEPIAAASLAQVFKAKLKDGRDVAVKVQYSDLQNRFTSDVGTIVFLQNILAVFFKNYNFGWIIQDARSNLLNEMDFVREAKNSEKCAKDLSQFKFVHIPDVHWEYTNKRILTLEWINGGKITDLDWIKSNKLNLKDIDTKLFNIFAEQIFNSGFVHADPHPGNILIRKTKSGKAELVLLDHGLYENLPKSVRQPLCEFWEATVLRDEKKMQECAQRLNINSYKNFAEVLFQVPFTLDGGEVKTKLTAADIEYMKEVGRKNFKMIMQTLHEMPRNLLFVVRNLNTIRAISREHGDPVDRPVAMARYAQKCLRSNYNSFLGFFQWIYRKARFEMHLMKKSLKLSVITLYIDFLYKIGRSPETSTTLFSTNADDVRLNM